MKTPREILLEQHLAATPKLDSVRAAAVARSVRPLPPEPFSWRELAVSLRWHLASLSAAWMVVLLLNMDGSPTPQARVQGDKIPSVQQVWASLLENRRLLLEYSALPAEEKAVQPGRRSEIQPEQVEV